MSEPKIAREVAEAELRGWCERLGAEFDDDDRNRILRLVMDGRLSFDEDAEAFTYRFRRPVALDNGESLSELRVREPCTNEVRDANKFAKGDAFEVALRLLARVAEKPLGVIERLGQKDLASVVVLFGFFG